MAGETILIADDSVCVQDVTRALLEEAGFNVIQASNGVAALTYPEINKLDLVVLDRDILDTPTTARLMKTEEATFRIPVLLLCWESNSSENESAPAVACAAGLLKKPFTPQQLLYKIKTILEERDLRRECEQYLIAAADKTMGELADSHIRSALDRKTEILTERTVQYISNQVSRRAQEEVDAKITSLSAEKEEELLKRTVREVAQTMIDKLAERKVLEVMDSVLSESTDKVVKQTAAQLLPELIRTRLNEAMESFLAREVTRRVQAEAETRLAEVLKHMIDTIDTVATQRMTKLMNDRFPEAAERQMQAACEKQIPTAVKGWVEAEIGTQLPLSIDPTLQKAIAWIRRQATRRFLWLATVDILLVAGLAAAFFWKFAK